MMIQVKLHLVAALLLACTVSARGFAQLPPKAGEQINLAIPSFNVTALPVYAAVDKGFLAAEGIDLRVIKVQGGAHGGDLDHGRHPVRDYRHHRDHGKVERSAAESDRLHPSQA